MWKQDYESEKKNMPLSGYNSNFYFVFELRSIEKALKVIVSTVSYTKFRIRSYEC
jgi:hypothetical protein